MTRKTDLVLLHAPSVYDFRKRSIMYGPISDVVPPTPIFDMYPIGFISILRYLELYGYKVRIINIALKMLEDPKFDPENQIKHLKSEAFGIDFHWLVHAQGSLELARIIKKHHPNSPVILGGLSSTYFHNQIIQNYPYVDYIIRGDSAEQPLLQLMQHIENKSKKGPENVQNITWRDSNNKIHINSLTFVPECLDDFLIDCGSMVKSALRYRDISGHLPCKEWNNYPITSVLACKGCIFNCITCGGSQYAYQKYYNRLSLAYSRPEKLVEEIQSIQRYLDGPTFILGDLRIIGKKYAESVFDVMKKEKVDNPLVIELFMPASKDYLEKIAKSVPNFNLEISPESHNEIIRQSFGRSYGNNELEKTISHAFKIGCRRFDIFFMIGLPYQTTESVLDTAEYCRDILEKYGKDKNLHPFIAPLAPFLDPGSIAFEDPKNHGYQLFFKELEDYRQAVTYPSWKYFLSYQTTWMTRDELVEVTYDVANFLNRIKSQFDLIDSNSYEIINMQIQSACNTLEKIDGIMKIDNHKVRSEELHNLKSQIGEINQKLLCAKDELLRWSI